MSWKQIKGYTAGAVAFVTCPCHLIIIWPILLALTAGTAFGVWLAANMLLVGIVMTVSFVTGLVLAFKWLTDKPISACELDKPKQPRARLQNERI